MAVALSVRLALEFLAATDQLEDDDSREVDRCRGETIACPQCTIRATTP
jgi:hypothetical protein